MATAEFKKDQTVLRTVETVEDVVVLTLTKSEAQHLQAVCGRIGGDNAHRGVFSHHGGRDGIIEVIEKATGDKYSYTNDISRVLEGHLVFRDSPDQVRGY